ncbi:MAG TPA: hypothetical protein VMV21_13150 [Vicinamibacteria bacterium]|nr:hypothetical protein [Vicinamibacteria bacterium]
MRVLATAVLLCGLAAPVLAQDQGSFALDAMTTPGRHFGAGYYLTNRFSLRPSLGFGYASDFGTTFNLGADLRFELMPGSRLSPYLAGGISYMRSPYLVADNGNNFSAGAGGASFDPSASSNVTRYGAGIGLRTRLKYGLSLVGEGRLMNSEIRDGYGGGGFYGQQVVQNGAHFEAAVGLSYVFN